MSNVRIQALVLLTLMLAASVSVVDAASRKIKPGDTTPEFSVQDLSGHAYVYTRQSENAVMVMFLSAKQDSSFKAQTDLVRILSQLPESAKGLDVVIALDDPNAFSQLTGLKKRLGQVVVTLDQEHHLWGRFGAIAMPTVVIANAQGQVVCYEAGYGYNFAPVIRSQLDKVLGVESIVADTAMDQVGTVSNATLKAKLARLIHASDMMAAKGHFDAAIVEIQKAQALDPNAIDVRILLAELFCKASKGNQALDTLQDTKGVSRSQIAKILLVTGWAHRLNGDLDEALRALVQSTEQAPGEARAFCELGRVYELKGLKDEALKAYRQALALLL